MAMFGTKIFRSFQVFLFLPLLIDATFSVLLESGEEMCYVVRVPRGSTSIISGNFDMIDDDLKPDPVGARLEDSGNVLWSSPKGAPEGIFEITSEEGGMHRFCLENGKHLSADGLDRTIGWAIRVRSKSVRSLEDVEQGPDAERAVRLAEWAGELQEHWETLLDHYSFLKTREAVHKSLTDQIMGRVIRWTAFEGLTLAAIAGGQILYLKKFMETRRYL